MAPVPAHCPSLPALLQILTEYLPVVLGLILAAAVWCDCEWLRFLREHGYHGLSGKGPSRSQAEGMAYAKVLRQEHVWCVRTERQLMGWSRCVCTRVRVGGRGGVQTTEEFGLTLSAYLVCDGRAGGQGLRGESPCPTPRAREAAPG